MADLSLDRSRYIIYKIQVVSTLRRIHAESISDQVYAFIEEDIVSRRYPPGSRIDLDEIERSLGISRIPIRDALERLIEKGLVRKIPRVGYFTVKLTPAEIQDLYGVRLLLEEYALSQGVTNIDRELAAELRQRIAAFSDRTDFSAEEKSELLQLDFMLHRHVIIGNSGSPLLESIYEGIKAKINLSTHFMYRLKDDIAEHLAILDAILAREQQRAIDYLRAHLQATRANALELGDDPNLPKTAAEE